MKETKEIPLRRLFYANPCFSSAWIVGDGLFLPPWPEEGCFAAQAAVRWAEFTQLRLWKKTHIDQCRPPVCPVGEGVGCPLQGGAGGREGGRWAGGAGLHLSFCAAASSRPAASGVWIKMSEIRNIYSDLIFPKKLRRNTLLTLNILI